MPVGTGVCTKDVVDRDLHLLDIDGCTSRKRFLHNGLFGTRASAESTLQSLIASQSSVDFRQPMITGKDGDERIGQLLKRRVVNGFLQNHDPLPNRFE